MAKLTYWIAHTKTDSDVYSVRAKTRKEVKTQVAAMWNSEEYSAPNKVTIEYKDAFDLMHLCISTEGGIREGRYEG